MTWLASGLVALAVWLAHRTPGGGLGRLRPERVASSHRDRRGSRVVVAAVGAMIAVGVWLTWGGRAGSVTICGVLVALTAAEVARATVVARTRRQRRAAVTEACDVFAAMLRLGRIPAGALAAAAEECPPLRDAAAAQAVGGDVVAALQRAATVPGQEDLARVGAAWVVATASGASMTTTMAAVAASLRADQAVSGVVRAELSAPRATGRLLAALPFAGLGLGYLVGGDPVHFLTDGWIGQVCLVAGVALGCLGLMWTDRLADKAGEVR